MTYYQKSKASRHRPDEDKEFVVSGDDAYVRNRRSIRGHKPSFRKNRISIPRKEAEDYHYRIVEEHNFPLRKRSSELTEGEDSDEFVSDDEEYEEEDYGDSEVEEDDLPCSDEEETESLETIPQQRMENKRSVARKHYPIKPLNYIRKFKRSPAPMPSIELLRSDHSKNKSHRQAVGGGGGVPLMALTGGGNSVDSDVVYVPIIYSKEDAKGLMMHKKKSGKNNRKRNKINIHPFLMDLAASKHDTIDNKKHLFPQPDKFVESEKELVFMNYNTPPTRSVFGRNCNKQTQTKIDIMEGVTQTTESLLKLSISLISQ